MLNIDVKWYDEEQDQREGCLSVWNTQDRKALQIKVKMNADFEEDQQAGFLR